VNDRRLRLGIALGLFVVVLAAYIETMAGSTSFWDSGEFVATAYSLGIPHPPATPLYVVLGRVFTMLPIPGMSIAQKVNFMSALFGSLGIVMLYLILTQVLRQVRGEAKTGLDRIVIHGSALVGSLFTAWSNTYWSNAVEAEVYAIASFVMGLTTLLALRWARDPKSPQSTRNIYLIIYLLSLCVGFHLGTVLVYPSVALFILLYRNKSVTDADVVIFSCGFLLFLLYVTTILKGGLAAVAVIVYLIVAIWRLAGGKRFVAVASLLFLLGITIHAFLLIRSAQNPAIDEADPQTFANLMAVLRREQYPPSNPFHRKGSWEFQIVDHFWRYFTEQYQLVRPPRGTGMALVPILVGLAGLVALARRSFRSFALLGSTFFITSIGMILFLNFSDGTRLDPRSGSVIPAEVRERDYFYSPAFYFFGVFIGIGLAALLDWFFAARKNQKLARWDRLGYTGGVALFLVFTCMLFVRYHFQHDRTRERIPWGYGYNMLVGLEPNALIFTNGDNDTFPLWYQQEVEGFRRDVRVLNLSLLNTTWYPRQLRDNEPRVTFNLTDEQIDNLALDAYTLYKQTQEEYQPRDLAAVQILRDNYGKRPIYFAVTIPGEFLEAYEDRLVLEGLVFRFASSKGKERVDHARLAENVDTKYRFDGILDAAGKRDNGVYRDSNQEILIQNYANAFIRLGRQAEEQASQAADDSTRDAWLSQARRRYETAYEISPRHEAVVLLLASLHVRMGESSRAVSLLESLLARDPLNDNALFELARLHLLESHFELALEALRQLDARNPNDEFLQQMLLEAMWGAGQRAEAERLVAGWEARHPGEPGRRLRQYLERLQTEAPGESLNPPAPKAAPAGGAAVESLPPSGR